VHQGDPLFLFVLAMEAFSKMLGAFTSKGLISSFSVGSSEPARVNISHLLFFFFYKSMYHIPKKKSVKCL
jgi:hypothetical protein